MKKLNKLGIGPAIALVAFPSLAVTIFLTLRYSTFFSLPDTWKEAAHVTGLVMVIAGAIMYFATVPMLLKGLKETRLITGGTYYLCCNPLYSAIILFIIPGVSLLMNTWVILTVSLFAWLVFRISITKEYEEMESFFGDEFKKYRSQTPELFPLPIKKIFNR